jgi:hypothetical protein
VLLVVMMARHYRRPGAILEVLLLAVSLPSRNLVIVNRADTTTEQLRPSSATSETGEESPRNQQAAEDRQHRTQDDDCGSVVV